MNNFTKIECLKLHFGLCFLSTFCLPSVQEVKLIINDAVKAFDNDLSLYHSALSKLKKIVSKTLMRKDELIYFSSGLFLRNFSDHVAHSNFALYPGAKDFGDFLKLFLHPDYLPHRKADLKVIYEWSLFAVQFIEGNENHTRAALKLLKEIDDYIVGDEQCESKKECIEKNDVVSNTTKDVYLRAFDEVDYGDTKPCDCYEYEMSGDCYCVYDI